MMIRGPKGYTLEDCPEKARHTRYPEGYLQWHAWAEKKAKTHRSTRCKGCGLFAVWMPKEQP